MSKSVLCLWLASTFVAFGQQYSITTVAGGAPAATPVPATAITIGQPRRVATDAAGNVYFSAGNSVYRMAGATLTLVAGNSRPGFAGDGGAAVNAQLNAPQGVSVDKAGNVYIADSLNNRVRMVTAGGTIATFAGNGLVGYVNAVGDGGPANQAQLFLPSGVAVDGSGNVYIADTGDNLIRKVTTDGNIATIAGNGYPSFSGDAGTAIGSSINHPEDVFVDGKGNVYIADTLNAAIRKITTDGNINTIAGDASIGYSGDGSAATQAGLIEPYAVAVDGSGNIFIAEPEDGRIRKVDASGNISTIAGNGTLGFAGDSGAGSPAQFYLPTGVAVDGSGNVYIADSQNNRVRKLSGGNVSTVAGNGGLSYSGDSGPALKAQLNSPASVAVDTAGNFYIADTANHVVRKVASGTIATILGNGTPGSGDNQLNGPQGIAVDAAGNVYVSDTQNARVRKIAAGAVTTVAGTGTPGFGGDGAAGASAQLNLPLGLAVDSAGNVYIADFANHRVRKVTPGGMIATLAGNGSQGYAGDGGTATLARLNGPAAVAVDSGNNVYIADSLNNRVRAVTAAGQIATVAGTGVAGSTGDGAPAMSAQIVNPTGIAVDRAGNLFISDASARVRKIYPNGPIFTVAGNGSQGYAGDGGPGVSAALNAPMGLAADAKGVIYIADSANNAIRLLQPSGTGLAVAAVVGGASNAVGAIAPGEVLVLYGSGMGPGQVVANQFNAAGVMSSNLAGTSVFVNGAPAPILYTSANQVSAIVPFGTVGSTAQIYVVYQGQVSAAVSIPLAAAAPAIFTLDYSGKGQAAAVNQDTSINGPAHPAKAGTYVSLYATGGGQTNPVSQDGAAPVLPVLPQPAGTVTATVGGKAAVVQYAGAAPNIVAGVMQINVQIPAGLGTGAVPVVVQVAGAASPGGVTIYVN